MRALFAGAGFGWSCVVTLLILLIMNRIPGLSLRTSTEGEAEGIDFDQFNEYTHDYIELQRDLYPPKSSSAHSVVTVTSFVNRNDTPNHNDMKMAKISPMPTVEDAW